MLVLIIYSIASLGCRRKFAERGKGVNHSGARSGRGWLERRRKRASEREGNERETRERRTPSTSATRFNYTLQTHDMSKSYTSYRLCHLLKVSSRAPRSRHRCSAARPLLSGALRKHIGRKAPKYTNEKFEKGATGGKRGAFLRSTQLQRFAW